MTVTEMLAAFDASSGTPERQRCTDPDVVKRLRIAIADGLLTFEPVTDRVEYTGKAHAKFASVNFHVEGGNA